MLYKTKVASAKSSMMNRETNKAFVHYKILATDGVSTMKRLSKREELNIRNWLDGMGDRLYHDVVLPEDAYRAYQTIKKLLFDIYMLQDGKKEREDDEENGNIGQSIVADSGDKQI